MMTFQSIQDIAHLRIVSHSAKLATDANSVWQARFQLDFCGSLGDAVADGSTSGGGAAAGGENFISRTLSHISGGSVRSVDLPASQAGAAAPTVSALTRSSGSSGRGGLPLPPQRSMSQRMRPLPRLSVDPTVEWPAGHWRRLYIAEFEAMRLTQAGRVARQADVGLAENSLDSAFALRRALDGTHWCVGAVIPLIFSLAALVTLGDHWNAVFPEAGTPQGEAPGYTAVFVCLYLAMFGIAASHALTVYSMVQAATPGLPSAWSPQHAGELGHPWGALVKGGFDFAASGSDREKEDLFLRMHHVALGLFMVTPFLFALNLNEGAGMSWAVAVSPALTAGIVWWLLCAVLAHDTDDVTSKPFVGFSLYFFVTFMAACVSTLLVLLRWDDGEDIPYGYAFIPTFAVCTACTLFACSFTLNQVMDGDLTRRQLQVLLTCGMSAALQGCQALMAALSDGNDDYSGQWHTVLWPCYAAWSMCTLLTVVHFYEGVTGGAGRIQDAVIQLRRQVQLASDAAAEGTQA